MRVRPAQAGDLPAIVAMLADDEFGVRREAPGKPLDPAYRAAFDAIDQDPNNVVLVLDDGAEVVGTLQVTFIPALAFRGGRRAQIEAVRVIRARRGEGLGRRLVDAAIALARDQGCHLVQLLTHKDRVAAHRFYEQVGFVPSHDGMKLYLTGSVAGR